MRGSEHLIGRVEYYLWMQNRAIFIYGLAVVMTLGLVVSGCGVDTLPAAESSVTATSTAESTALPIGEPSMTSTPMGEPTAIPSPTATPQPVLIATVAPTLTSTAIPTTTPTVVPTVVPIVTKMPVATPTATPAPTSTPVAVPTIIPTPTVIASADFPTIIPTGDSIAPELTGLSVSPQIISTGDGSQVVRFTLDVVDNLSGMNKTSQAIDVCTKQLDQMQSFCVQAHDSSRTAGTTLDGTYKTEREIPQYSPTGTWVIDQIGLYDNVGNSRFYSQQDLIDLGFDITFESESVGDSMPPVLTGLSISSLDTSTVDGSQSVQFTLDITDDLSGAMQSSQLADVCTKHEDQAQSFCVQVRIEDLIAGDLNNGTFTTSRIIPQFSPTGRWIIDQIALFDNVGNLKVYFYNDLVELGFEAEFQVAS